jgi:hypothetical protein
MKHAVLASALAGLLAAAPAAAATFSYDATTAGGPTWQRPVDAGPVLSSVGAATPYHVESFVAGVTGPYDFLSVQDDWDGYLFLYRTAFDPTDQLTNLLAGNDDFPGPGQSGFDDVALTTGTTYLIVTTGFDNVASGTFTNTVTFDGAPAVIPLPGSLPVLLAGLAGLGLVARRRQAP